MCSMRMRSGAWPPITGAKTADPERGLAAVHSDLARLLRDAEAHDLLGQYARAAEILHGLIASARRPPGDEPVLVAALTRRAGLLRYEGLLEPARTLLDEATGIAEADADVRIERLVACQLAVELGRWHLESSGPDAADPHLDRAVDLARSLEDQRARAIELAASLAALGASKRVRGDYATAERLLHEAVQYAQVATDGDPDDLRAAIELVHALDELGVLGKFSGDFQSSEATYGRALDLLTTVAGPDHPDVATLHHNLGGLAHARGDGSIAEAFARSSVELHERSLGPDHLATVLDRSALAAVLDQQGATAEAESMLRDCAERLERTLGANHRELAVVLNNLAAIAQREGRLDEAEALYRRTTAIKEWTLGPDSPSLAITLNNLGTVQRRQGRFSDAAANYGRALAILLTSAGPDHPHVDVIRRNLALLGGNRGV